MLYMEAGEWYKTAEGREVNGDRVSRLLVLDSLSLTRLNKLGLVACSPFGFDPCPPELILGLQVRGRRGVGGEHNNQVNDCRSLPDTSAVQIKASMPPPATSRVAYNMHMVSVSACPPMKPQPYTHH